MVTPFQQAKRKARRDAHTTFGVPAYLYPAAGGDPVSCTVREHHKFQRAGDLQGTNLSYAEVLDDSPRLVIDRTQVLPSVRDVVSTTNGFVFRISAIQPPDGDFVSAEVVRITNASDMELYPAPEDE